MTIATEHVYVDDPSAEGVKRLVAAPGDEIPTTPPPSGIVTTPDPPTAVSEPLDGYDALSEDEILALLPNLDSDQLAAVQAYESEHAARGAIARYGQSSTVVTSRAAQRTVPAESTSSGYDKMKAEDLQAEADRRSLTVQGTGANGNVIKQDLVAALQADDAKADE